MWRAMPCRRRDDGFTVVELVVAAAILFFALTALVGLLGASTRMTASSKSRSVLTNAIASELEKIRTLRIEEVDYDTSGGLIPHTKVLPAQGGVTVTLTYTITDRTVQNNTKEILIRGVGVRPGFPDVRFSSFAVIRDRIGGTVRDTGSNGPMIEFDDASPPGGSVLEGSKIGGTSTNIQIVAHAWSETGNNIMRFEYTVDSVSGSVPLKETNTVYPGALSWHDVESPSDDEVWAFSWNTNQRDTSNNPELRDGMRTVTIIAYDDQGRASVPMRRTFIVDNYPPASAPGVTLTNTPNTDLTQVLALTWAPVVDGDRETDHYAYELYEKLTSSETITDWTPVTVSPTTKTASALPLGVYAARVQAHSVLDKASPWGQSAVVITRPVLNGTHDVSRVKYNGSNDTWTYTSRFSIPKPRVPYSAVNVVMERTGGGAANATTDITAAVTAKWNAGQPYDFSQVLAQTIKKNVNPTPPEYRLKVTITPAGGAAQTVYSNYALGSIPNISNTSPPATNLSYAVRW